MCEQFVPVLTVLVLGTRPCGRVCVCGERNQQLRFALLRFVVVKERLVPGFHAPAWGRAYPPVYPRVTSLFIGLARGVLRMAFVGGCVAGGSFGVGGFVCCAQLVVARAWLPWRNW